MAEEARPPKDPANPILHVLVVGFHHKKGCQVEYSYPPLVEGDDDPTACPAGWKYLPTLALPDGSHNFDEDEVFFHLPSLIDPKSTVFGISCYRQISVEKLRVRTADLTRSSVQKAVCVLSALPLFGHVRVKMQLIAHAYFDEGDFAETRLLREAFAHLNACMSGLGPLRDAPQLYIGLSPRELILHFGHKALLLWKLLLLERRVIFFRSPVQPLCAAILTLLSMHPGMIEAGLREAACIRPSRPMSPIPDFSEEATHHGDTSVGDADIPDTNTISLEDTVREVAVTQNSSKQSEDSSNEGAGMVSYGNITLISSEAVEICNNSQEKSSVTKEDSVRSVDSTVDSVIKSSESNEVSRTESGDLEGDSEADGAISEDRREEWMEVSECKLTSSESMTQFPSVDASLAAIAQVDIEACGLPLRLYTQGNLCLPYLSLPYMDLLSDVNVRGFVVGATNVLFKQKRNLADVLIEVSPGRVETRCPELRRQLRLTTEDLRFSDHVCRRVAGERHDVFLDGVGWEGGDEWIRAQFRAYAVCLLRTSMLPEGSRELEPFNAAYMSALRATHAHQAWSSERHGGMEDVPAGHPFAGQLSVADMRLRLAHTMQNTDGGRKLNAAMATTGRAVGGAISSARGALSSWWTTLVAPPSNAPEDDSSPSDLRPNFQSIPDEATNLGSAEVEPTQLAEHVSPRRTRLVSVQNIECCPSTHEPPTGDDVPSTCNDVPSTLHDVPSMCHDVPSTCDDVPSTCDNVVSTDRDSASSGHDVPSTCRSVPSCNDMQETNSTSGRKSKIQIV